MQIVAVHGATTTEAAAAEVAEAVAAAAAGNATSGGARPPPPLERPTHEHHLNLRLADGSLQRLLLPAATPDDQVGGRHLPRHLRPLD